MRSVSARRYKDPSLGGLVAGRFELVERIAQGGVGEVFAARDMATGKKLALKRLLRAHRDKEPMLRVEYHALARLRHPYIIQVYEYGMDRGTPYYTMELLDGRDLREIPQASVREACRYVRDVASSLALLHAQRLLHRDVSPRNVRLTSSGQCKLLDFGMMVPFGVPPNVAGTPPFVSPEAWEGSVLDQRSDLYSLGALAYWLITRKLPPDTKTNSATGVRQIPWRMQRSVASVPAALDDLVMALLEVDPAKRPASAAEVILSLNAIAGLEPDDSIELAHSYLSSARFVGRREELASFEKQLSNAEDGKGSAVLVSGPAGIGRTRFLQELTLHAETRGFQVLHALSGRTVSNMALAREIYRSLRRVVPEAFGKLPRDQQSMLHELDQLERGTMAPGTSEARAQLQAALRNFFHTATEQGSWMLAIDDLDVADQFSSAFVASLTRDADARQLVIAATATHVDDQGFSPARSFAQNAALLRLPGLELNEVRSLTASLFGAVPNLERLVDWLFREAHGNPGLTMELASLLLRRGTIRYVEGAFLLPQGPIEEPVPPDLARTLLLRLDGLTSHARKTADLLAVRRGNTSIDLCLAASELSEEETLGAVEELVGQGVLMSVRGEYAFVQEALREGILTEMPGERRRALHGQLARALLPEAEPEHRLEAGWHLLHTEDELDGADVLAEVTPSLIETGIAYSAAISATEKALDVYERRGAPLSKRLAMRSLLMRAGYLYDYRLCRRYGEDTLALLDDWMDGKRLRSLQRYFGAWLPLTLAFVWLTVKYVFSWGARRGPAPYLTLKYLCRSLLSMIGVHVLALDVAGARRLAERLEFLRGAPRLTSGRQVYLASRSLVLQPQGRESEFRMAGAEALATLNKYHARDMTPWERQDLAVGLMMSAGINECYRVGSEALAHADALDRMGTQLARAAAQRIRFVYYAVRAIDEEVERSRRMLEVHAIQGGTTWQVEWFSLPVEGLAAARSGDLVTARRCLERLEQLSPETPSLCSMRDMLRVHYHQKRGDLERAVQLGERFVAEHPPGSVIGWAVGHAVYAAALNDLLQHEQARAVCERALAHVSDADREYASLYSHLDTEWAVACAALGDTAPFETRSSERVQCYEAAREYSWLCLEYDIRARVALLLGDRERMKQELNLMRQTARRVNSKALVARTSRRAAYFMRSVPGSERPPLLPDGLAADVQSPLFSSDNGETRTPVRGFTRSRAHNMLRRAVEQADASDAFMFVLTAEGVKLVAAAGSDEPPEEVAGAAQTLLEAQAEPGEAVLASTAKTLHAEEHTYELLLLPRASRRMRPALLALGRPKNRVGRELPQAVLEKLTEWAVL